MKATSSSFFAKSQTAPDDKHDVCSMAPGLSATAPKEPRALMYFWYALTVPARLLLVFVCAWILIFGICFLQVFGKQEG